MTNEINNLFVTEGSVSTVGNRGLSGTAQLTNLASNLATSIIREMNDDIDNYVDDIRKSQADNNAMDALIDRFDAVNTADFIFLFDIDNDTLDGMLKSQQSKRSRCKSKAMTMDNYKALMTGAIAERFIRSALGKEKNAGGPRRQAGAIEYTIEQLQMFSVDQERLKKEIRNIQSKKSIMKSKADFDPGSERYQQLLKAEQQLKDMKTNAVAEVIEVDTTKDALQSLLAGKDIEHLKAGDSKALLAQIAAMIGSEVPVDADNEDERGGFELDTDTAEEV